MPTAKDVARKAGVSASTVSRVINEDPRISPETRDKVLQCIEDLGYRVNNIARSLKTNKTYTIGFLCPELVNDFFMKIAEGIEDELGKCGYSMLVCTSNGTAAGEEERIRLLFDKCIDGLIVIPASNAGRHFQWMLDMQIPVVLADRLVEGLTADAVLVDNFNGTYLAIEHTIKQGERRIGYIGGDLALTTAKERDDGYRKALESYSIPLDPAIVKYGDFHTESGYAKMRELMELENPPGCVFIANRYMHIGATKYLIEHAKPRKEGQSVSIVSFDDIDLVSSLGFCKTVVKQPILEIGTTAAKLLLDRINGESRPFPQIIRLKTELE
jgi:LacI family transcriptional regulator